MRFQKKLLFTPPQYVNSINVFHRKWSISFGEYFLKLTTLCNIIPSEVIFKSHNTFISYGTSEIFRGRTQKISDFPSEMMGVGWGSDLFKFIYK